MLKPIILFAALILPGCIFFFLKVFGDNQFDIPTYYQEQYEFETLSCEQLSAPYAVNNRAFEQLTQESKNRLNSGTISIIAVALNNDDTKNYTKYIAQLKDRLEDDVQMVLLMNSTINDNAHTPNADVVLGAKEQQMNDIIKCTLLITDNDNKWVLLDKENRIRGYYKNTQKEIDRLAGEVKVLLDGEDK